MRTSTSLLFAALLPASTLLAQVAPPPATPNDHLTRFVTGLDIQGRINSSFAHVHNSTLGITAPSMSTTACNPGTVLGVWEAAPDEDHPFICQLYTRLHEGRFEQINNRSYVKHSFGSTNSNECNMGCIGGAAFNRLGINCSDTYGSTLNNSRTYLGPPGEINGWTGEWNMFGSHLDVGYPAGAPDGNTSTVNPTTNVQFRVNIEDSKLGAPGASYFAAVYYLHKWEPTENRANNMSSLPVNITTGSTNSTGSIVYGPILETRYTGARVESAANMVGGVAHDGTFYVGVHVTQNTNGTYHYEYAVHNRDNAGGNAEFRIPLCPTASLSGVGFKDIDLDALNDWTHQRVGSELVFSAPISNAQGWNTIYNFWFDTDLAPGDGTVTILEGVPNPGANPTVTVAADVPSVATTFNLGGDCASGINLSANDRAFIPNPTLRITATNAPFGAPVALHINTSGQSVGLVPPIGPTTCDLLIPDVAIPGFTIINVAFWTVGIPNDPSLEGSDVFFQTIHGASGGPVLGLATLSNQLQLRVGNSLAGCP